MKLPFSWLSEYVDLTGITPKEYNARMTMSGSKVEGIDFLGEEIENVRTAQIVSVVEHPDSDHLKICKLSLGEGEPIQIVTGAPNITEASVGDVCPVAVHPAMLPGGVKIKKGKLRGVESYGMMCSFVELGIDHGVVPYACENGILIFPKDTPVGVDVKEVLGLNDYVADFEITSNRPDCLSVSGLALETAATFDIPIQMPKIQVQGNGQKVQDYLSVQVEEPTLCPRYMAAVVQNVQIAPAPAWMRQRLFAAGIRPINNIVDITNYVMLEMGQPLHAFDYACLSDQTIVVRKPRAGETIETLDGQVRMLTSDMLAICDGQKPVAVAGVMGGANSEITNQTSTIVLESACFHGATVRKTAQALGMRTEASARFEKDLSPRGTEIALGRACQLIEALGAGEVVGGVVDVDTTDAAPKRIAFEPEKINALLGIDLTETEQICLLARLQFVVEEGEVIVPWFRTDIERTCDLAEEVARMYGYDRIPTTVSASTVQGKLTHAQQCERKLGRLCRAMGFHEAMTYSFISPKFYDQILWQADDVRRISTTIRNPLGEENSIMRTTALPSLLEALAHNYAHRLPSASLYEIGTVYHPVLVDGKADANQLPKEEKMLTLASFGRLDFFTFKGMLESLLNAMDIQSFVVRPIQDNPSYHPGRTAGIYHGDMLLGVFGAIHPLVAKNFGIEEEVLVAEFALPKLLSAMQLLKKYQALPKFPASTRDIAVLVEESVPAGLLEEAIGKATGTILEEVRLFDVYQGANIPAGQKSVAFSLVLRAGDHTLCDEECDQAVQKALQALEAQFGAVLRS